MLLLVTASHRVAGVRNLESLAVSLGASQVLRLLETTPAAINIAVGLTMAADITTGARPIISSLASSIANPYIASLFIAVPSIRPLIIMAGLVSVIQGSAAPR